MIKGTNDRIDFYGWDTLRWKAIEELGELQTALARDNYECSALQRGLLEGLSNTVVLRSNIIEELGDVLITLEYIKAHYHIKDSELNATIERKVARQHSRMGRVYKDRLDRGDPITLDYDICHSPLGESPEGTNI